MSIENRTKQKSCWYLPVSIIDLILFIRLCHHILHLPAFHRSVVGIMIVFPFWLIKVETVPETNC